ELSLEILQVELITKEQQHSKQQRCHYDLERPWPGADIVEVEVVEIDLLQTFHGLSKTHCCCSPSAAFAPGSVWRTDISNTLACSNAPWVTAFTAVRLGEASQSDASI